MNKRITGLEIVVVFVSVEDFVDDVTGLFVHYCTTGAASNTNSDMPRLILHFSYPYATEINQRMKQILVYGKGKLGVVGRILFVDERM